jgi:hypothetical protein
VTIPVLILGFKQPEELLSRIEDAVTSGVSEIYIAIDGYSGDNNLDQLSNLACIKIAKEMLSLGTATDVLINDRNFGQGVAIPKAIEWFLRKVNFGAIIEDDCHFTSSFINYVTKVREQFEKSSNVAAICGTNIWPVELMQDFQNELILTPFFECWGWATSFQSWQRNFLVSVNEFDSKSLLSHVTGLSLIQRLILWRTFRTQIQAINNGTMTTWALRFTLGVIKNRQYCIFPNENLILHSANPRAAHVRSTPSWYRSVMISNSYLVPDFIENGNLSIDRLNRYEARHMYGSSITRILKGCYHNFFGLRT